MPYLVRPFFLLRRPPDLGNFRSVAPRQGINYYIKWWPQVSCIIRVTSHELMKNHWQLDWSFNISLSRATKSHQSSASIFLWWKSPWIGAFPWQKALWCPADHHTLLPCRKMSPMAFRIIGNSNLLFYRLCRLTKIASKHHLTDPLWGNSTDWRPGDSTHKGPLYLKEIRQKFSFYVSFLINCSCPYWTEWIIYFNRFLPAHLATWFLLQNKTLHCNFVVRTWYEYFILSNIHTVDRFECHRIPSRFLHDDWVLRKVNTNPIDIFHVDDFI